MDVDAPDDGRRVATTDDQSNTPGADRQSAPGVDHWNTLGDGLSAFNHGGHTGGGVVCPA